jgi:L-threonylcarbamoyladenylate synthase
VRRTRSSAAIEPAGPPAIQRAGALLRHGKLVAIPTETVYGLAGDATSDAAVAAIFAAKGRPHLNPTIVQFADADAAWTRVARNDRAARLAAAFWPGALTLVLPRRAECDISFLASAGRKNLGVRVPGHPVARAVVEAAGCPIALPSANPAGGVSPTTAAHVAHTLGDSVALILDDGPCRIGVESTVLDLCRARAVLLRPGGLDRAAIEAVIGPLVMPDVQATATAAIDTRRPLRLGATAARPGEALLAFGRRVPEGFAHVLNLSVAGDTTEAAGNLFAMLRALDRPEFSAIAVMPIPDTGLGHAINDRLRRAAASASP